MKKQTHLHLGWPEGEYYLHQILFCGYKALISLILFAVSIQYTNTNTPLRLIYGTVCGPNLVSDSLHLHECPAVPIRRERFSPRLSGFILLVSTAFPLSLRAYLTTTPTRNTPFNACNDATMNSVVCVWERESLHCVGAHTNIWYDLQQQQRASESIY